MSSGSQENISDPPPTPSFTQGGGQPSSDNNSLTHEANGGRNEMSSPPGSRSWERPWTLEEVRKGANNWSLAGDAGLLLLLQEFSQRMVSQTHEIEKKVDGLVSETKSTGVSLNNVFNDFIMLANTQFVENRVYDEDVTQESDSANNKQEEKEKTREQREADLIPRVSEALNLGFSVIDNSFEKLDVNVGNSDSEDENEPAYRGELILEPKDPYLHRPLPYVIGTQAFLQDDDIGLADVTSEEDAESDHGSLSESESESESEEEEKPVTRRRPVESETESEYTTSESEDEDLFSKAPEDKRIEDIEDYIARNEAKKTAEPTDFASQLSAKLSSIPSENSATKTTTESEHRKEKDTHKKSTSKSKKENKEPAKEDALFGNQNEEDEDSPFARKGGLFSGGGGLFDDDGDEGGLFDDVITNKSKPVTQKASNEEVQPKQIEEEPVAPPKTKSGNKVPAGGVSIFAGDDDDNDLFADILNGQKKTSTQTTADTNQKKASTPNDVNTVQKKATPSGGGLFDDEDEDDLFAAESVNKVQPKSQSKSKPKTVTASSLFDDDDDDLFAVVEKSVKKEPEVKKQPGVTTTKEEIEDVPKETTPAKKVPVGGVSLFGSASNPLTAAIKAQRQHKSDDEEEEAWSDEEILSPESSTKSVKSTPSSSTSGSKVIDQKQLSASASSNSLFAEEPEDDLFAPKLKDEVKQESGTREKGKPPAGPLFNTSTEEDDDLFSATTQKPAKPTSAKGRSNSLFVEDDAGDDLFGSSGSKVKEGKKKPVGGVALFGGSDLFAEAKNKVEKREENTVVKESSDSARSRTGTKVSLFDDDETDSSDLFSPTTPTAPSSRPTSLNTNKTAGKPRSKSKSLFEDEDVLFGGAEADPAVDLFGAQSPLSPTQPLPKTVKTLEKKPSVDEAQVKPGDKLQVAGTTTSASSTDTIPVKKATPPKVPPRRSEILKIAGATSTESSSDLFGGSPEESDLFAPKPTSVKPPSPSTAASKPKKYAGAVSMFGALDPSSLVKKDQSDTVDQADGGHSSKQTAAESKSRSGSKSSYDGPTPFGNTTATTGPSGFKSVSAPKPKSTVNKLQSDLSINTSALLPGSSLPVKEAEPVSVSFDKPADVDILRNVSKDRAKITTRRRPPTRKARQAGARLSGIDFTDSSTDTSPVSPPEVSPVSQSVSFPDSNKAATEIPPPAASTNEDLFSGGSVRSTSKANRLGQSPNKSEPQRTNEIVNGQANLGVENDLFSSNQKEQSKNISSASAAHQSNVDDVFSNKTAPSKAADNDIFKASKSISAEKTSSVVTGQIDDIFANIKGIDDISKKQTKPVIDDDIFADASVSVKKTIPHSKSEDVFSPRKDIKPATNSLPPEDDDIFASIPKEKRKPKKAVSKDEDIFTDNTDIFADLPPAKPREKKTTKKLAVTTDKPLFKDTVDDIFADVKPKQKKNTPKKKADSGPSIFDDNKAGNIFDDPLNAGKP